jgi:hypothetical protein
MHAVFPGADKFLNSARRLSGKGVAVLIEVAQTGLADEGPSPLYPVFNLPGNFITQGNGERQVEDLVIVNLIDADGVGLDAGVKKGLVGALKGERVIVGTFIKGVSKVFSVV